jgi:hypothetical protein
MDGIMRLARLLQRDFYDQLQAGCTRKWVLSRSKCDTQRVSALPANERFEIQRPWLLLVRLCGRGCGGQRFATAFRFHFLCADTGLKIQQLQLVVAELLAFRPVFADQLQAQPFFQRLDFQARPLQFLRQKYDLFGFGTGYIIGESRLRFSTVDRSHLSNYANLVDTSINLLGLRRSLVRVALPVYCLKRSPLCWLNGRGTGDPDAADG